MHPNINMKELSDLMERVQKLSLAEQVYLIELIAGELRKTHLTDHAAMEKGLAEMAADPAIQAEIALWSGSNVRPAR